MGGLVLRPGCLILVESVLCVALGLGVRGSSSRGVIIIYFAYSSVFYFELDMHRYMMVAASF